MADALMVSEARHTTLAGWYHHTTMVHVEGVVRYPRVASMPPPLADRHRVCYAYVYPGSVALMTLRVPSLERMTPHHRLSPSECTWGKDQGGPVRSTSTHCPPHDQAPQASDLCRAAIGMSPDLGACGARRSGVDDAVAGGVHGAGLTGATLVHPRHDRRDRHNIISQ
jgi:hypothetical protein